MREPLSSIYKSFRAGGPDAPLAKAEMERIYRSTWRSGSARERHLVLNFIFLSGQAQGFDLVIEGLRSSEPEVAETAIAATITLLSKGFDLGEGTRAALADFHARFPDWEPLSTAALKFLEERRSGLEDAGEFKG